MLNAQQPVRFGMASLTGSAMRPVADLVAETNDALDEIASRQTQSAVPDLVTTALNTDKIWAKYNAPRKRQRD